MGSGGTAPQILTLTLGGGEWSPSRPGRFTPRQGVSDRKLDELQSQSGPCGVKKYEYILPSPQPMSIQTGTPVRYKRIRYSSS
jgi:hypothetical protein